jgi:UDP-MurNAc hydroxylase
MQITYLGHAGFLVETEKALLLADPWFSSEGAFDSAWFQFPCNHHLAPAVRERFLARDKQRFVYVSHEHRDHFDPHFLRTLPVGETTFLVPRFQRDALRVQLDMLKPGKLVLCNHGEAVPFADGSATFYLDDSGINRDSSILLRADGHTFLNMNDCKLYDELAAIRLAEGPISVLTCQFSGATWHPTCYDYEEEEYQRIARKKQTNKFEMVARAIETVRPQTFLPSAGPACFLDPTLLHINFQPVNIFPRAAQFLEYLRTRTVACETRLLDIMPGDVVHAAGHFGTKGGERVTEANFEAYLRSYSARYADYFNTKQTQPTNHEAQVVLDRLSVALQRKLDAFELYDRLESPLYFAFSDVTGKVLQVDFRTRGIQEVSSIPDTDHYSLTTPSWQISRVLDGELTWEEFALTFRVRLNRRPDVYQTLIQGFLLLEAEDMNWFCRKLLEIERSGKRAIVEAGGMRYSIDRYCPHQGADLTQGWAADGKLWTCPRHRWQFALDKDGTCLSSNGSIHAICLESD